MQIISRAEAKAKGLTRYFTGEPCKRGHIAPRFVKGMHCAECRKYKKQAPQFKFCQSCGNQFQVVNGGATCSYECSLDLRLQKPCPKCGTVGRRHKNGTCALCATQRAKLRCDTKDPARITRRKARLKKRKAKARGLTTYFTGEPCKRGHIAERFTRSNSCIECARVDGRNRYRQNPEKFRLAKHHQYQKLTLEERKEKNGKNYKKYGRTPKAREYKKVYGITNKEKISQATLKRYYAKRDEILAQQKIRYYGNDEVRERIKQNNTKWRHKISDLVAALRAVNSPILEVFGLARQPPKLGWWRSREAKSRYYKSYYLKHRRKKLERLRQRDHKKYFAQYAAQRKKVSDLVETLRKINDPILKEFGL